MKKNTIILIILIIILFGFNVKLLLQVKDQESQSHSKVKELQEVLEQKEKKYRNNFYFATQNEQLNLDNELKLISIDGDTILAKDAFNNTKLALRYTESNCRMCVDAEHDILIKNAVKLEGKLVILSTYSRLRGGFMDFKKLKEKGLENIKIYLVPDGLEIPLEEQNTPYYFVVHNDLRTNSFFIPAKEDPNLSKHYIESILKNLNNEE